MGYSLKGTLILTCDKCSAELITHSPVSTDPFQPTSPIPMPDGWVVTNHGKVFCGVCWAGMTQENDGK